MQIINGKYFANYSFGGFDGILRIIDLCCYIPGRLFWFAPVILLFLLK